MIVFILVVTVMTSSRILSVEQKDLTVHSKIIAHIIRTRVNTRNDIFTASAITSDHNSVANALSHFGGTHLYR